MDYNLLEEKWIPVLYRNGRNERIGICKAFEDAHMILQIAASNPMDRLAILRFLLALLYWCKGNPPDKIPDDSFPPDWFTKLSDHKECFNLLGVGKRFYQWRLRTDGKLSANYLIQEIPTGINFWHFKHATDGKDGLCPACCAMGLLRLPLFATSGGSGKSPGINGKPPIYFIPLGSSLAETLLLSWRKISCPDLGTPAWENPDVQLPTNVEVPLLTGMTWLPRRVWLDDPDPFEAACISCGRKAHLIRKCIFAGIGSTRTNKENGDRVWSDPHVMYKDKDHIKTSNALDTSDASAGQWTNIMGGILGGQIANQKIWVVNFATAKMNKYIETIEYEILLPNEIQDHKKIERWQEEGAGLIKKIKPQKSSRKHVEIRPMVDAIRPHVESKVLASVGELVKGDDESWEQAAREYSTMMKVVAKSLSPGFTCSALERRRQIENIKPECKLKNRH